jgi:putative sigma-54 modulation protein
MQVNVAFRHMDASPAIQHYASEKLQHVVSKYVQGEDVDSQITFSVEKFWHIANFTININGLTLKCIEKSEDMYSSVDLALEKIDRQVRRYKSRIRKHRPDNRQRNFTMHVVAPVEAEAEADEPQREEEPVQTLKREVFTAPFMNVDQAIMQLELRSSQFFVFTHEESERINIVYRRDDGNFGLIEAEPQHH